MNLKKNRVVNSGTSSMVMMLAGAVILLSGFVMGVLTEKMVGVGGDVVEVESELTEMGDVRVGHHDDDDGGGHVGHGVYKQGVLIGGGHHFGGPEVIVERLKSELRLDGKQVLVVRDLIGKGLHRIHKIHEQVGPELEGVHEGMSRELKVVLDAGQYKKWMTHFVMMKKYHLKLKQKYGDLPLYDVKGFGVGEKGEKKFMIKGGMPGGSLWINIDEEGKKKKLLELHLEEK